MREGRGGWRWAGLGLIGALAAVFASFNAGERVALNLGFTVLYRVPLVTLIFIAFLVGMVTMFLLGLRHDLRVRRALREAGFGEPMARGDAQPAWDDDELGRGHDTDALPDPFDGPPSAEAGRSEEFPRASSPESEPPPRYPP